MRPAHAGRCGRCSPRAGRPARDAIVTSGDRLAAVVYSVAAELRLRIGHDLAVTGFDGTDAAGLLHPRLTSVAIPVDDIARRVVARALRQIDHGPDLHPGEIVPARLRLGESTGHDPRAHRAPAVPGRPDAPPPAEEEGASIWQRPPPRPRRGGGHRHRLTAGR